MLKVRFSPSKKKLFIFTSMTAIKIMNNAFISSQKLFPFLRYRHLCPISFVYIGKRLDKKVKVNFKIYDVTSWNTNNCSKHITRYLKK